MRKNRCVLLDRDGVINYDSEEYIKSPAEWEAIPGSIEAIARLYNAGFQIAVVTNQSGVGRGLYTEDDLIAINNKMLDALWQHEAVIECVYYCPHTPTDNCECRKPKPGLIHKALWELRVEARDCILVGDSERDILAAHAGGVDAVLVETGNGLITKEILDDNVPVYTSLAAWTEDYLSWQ